MQPQAAYLTGFAKINSRMKKKNKMGMDKEYQGHAKALTKFGRAPNVFLTLK